MSGIWQMGTITSPSIWDMAEVGEFGVSINGVGAGGIIRDGQTGVLVTGAALNTVTSAIIETSDGTYQSDVTASWSASSATEATFNHTRGDVPLSTSSYQLRLNISDGSVTDTYNITINPAIGWQVIELAAPVVITDPESGFAPYTGSDPVVGDQMLVPTVTSTEGAPIIPQDDSSLYYNYSSFSPVPSTDEHTIEYFSDGGSGRVWNTSTMTVKEPVPDVAPQGIITFGTINVTDTTASVAFSYSDTDQTGYQYSLDGAAWQTATSPIALSGLTGSTPYSIRVRAINASGTGSAAETTFTTEATPQVPQSVITITRKVTTSSTISIEFVYDDNDATSYEHSTDDGATWSTVTSPISRTGLSAGTEYTGLIRPVNTEGSGTEVAYTVVTLAAAKASGAFSGLKDTIVSRRYH